MELPKPYQRSASTGRELSSDPDCRGPPRAASAVNAAAISPEATITGGTRISRPRPNATAARTAHATTTVRLTVRSGRSLYSHGTRPVSSIAPGRADPTVAAVRTTRASRRKAPTTPTATSRPPRVQSTTYAPGIVSDRAATAARWSATPSDVRVARSTASGEPSMVAAAGAPGPAPKSTRVRVRSVNVMIPIRRVLADVAQPGNVVPTR